jgi:hypothetical protein
MSEGSSQKTTNAVALQVKLKPVDRSDQPLTANYTSVGVAQGIAYLDFGFIEPTLMATVFCSAQNGGHVPKNLEGTLAARVAMPLEVALPLRQQLQQVLAGFRRETTAKP